MIYALLALLVTAMTASVDYAHARYIVALGRVDAPGEPWYLASRHVAARWSVAQWLAATLSFVVAVKVSLGFLPFEAVGLYLGSMWGRGR